MECCDQCGLFKTPWNDEPVCSCVDLETMEADYHILIKALKKLRYAYAVIGKTSAVQKAFSEVNDMLTPTILEDLKKG